MRCECEFLLLVGACYDSAVKALVTGGEGSRFESAYVYGVFLPLFIQQLNRYALLFTAGEGEGGEEEE